MANGEPPEDNPSDITTQPLPDDAPEGLDEPEGGERAPAKVTQAEANYREGNPQRSCGLCGHFDSKGSSCDVVEGDISPFGFSDLYLRQDNPFREGETDSFKGGRKVALGINPVPSLLQIGRQTYGGG